MIAEKIRYGIMPERDYDTMNKTLALVCDTFPEGVINTTEIGVHRGDTSRGIHKFFTDRNRIHFHTGIDNGHDLPITQPYDGCNIILGDSLEVSDSISNNSQHFVFIDGNHSFLYTVSDFLLYKNKVRIGGFIAFHNTGAQIQPKTDFQYIGDRENFYSYISCRRAIKELGLLDDKFYGWRLIMDEYDESKHTGGMTVFQKIKQ